MKMIGGFFPLEYKLSQDNFFDSVCHENWDLQFTMSGRCAIYHALNDLKKTDTRRVAYLPAYTCETVVAPYKKAGYQLYFYDVSRDMTPVFDERMLDRISVLSLCGYYGFCNYDRIFVKTCRSLGIAVIEDVTHSVFSADGMDGSCNYIVGSLRKWFGIAGGGFAIKTTGRFDSPLLPSHSTHLLLRDVSMSLKADALRNGSKELMAMADQAFWDAEMMLRDEFDAFESETASSNLMIRFDYRDLAHKRRQNYQYLLDMVRTDRSFTIVFPELKEGIVPSHFTIYHPDRDRIKQQLQQESIQATVYWPVNGDVDLTRYPQAAYIYDHVLSLPCDQRYGKTAMKRIAAALNRIGK